tara:strand:- start:6 stop:293 length:288 start_codon:yes stop_codon:yes gene_type:complete
MSSPFQKTFSGKKPFITPQTQKTDTIRVNKKYKIGDYVSEDDIEGTFSQKGKNPKNYPQLSAQDYSEVKGDKNSNYITKLKEVKLLHPKKSAPRK